MQEPSKAPPDGRHAAMHRALANVCGGEAYPVAEIMRIRTHSGVVVARTLREGR